MKNPNDTIGNRTSGLPACSAVPQPTVPPPPPPTTTTTTTTTTNNNNNNNNNNNKEILKNRGLRMVPQIFQDSVLAQTSV